MRGASRPPMGALRSVVGGRAAEMVTTESTRKFGALAAPRRWRSASRPGTTNRPPELRLVTVQAVEKTRAALTAYRETPAVEEAARVFDEMLTPAEQLAIAEEVVLTRAVELARAYPNTVAISFGPRRRHGNISPGAPPCVRFLVGAKWPASTRRVPPKGTIPRRLMAMATVGDRRVLCAMPTDVEDARFSKL
jgi:hypothetical protein